MCLLPASQKLLEWRGRGKGSVLQKVPPPHNPVPCRRDAMIAFRLNGQATTYDGDPAVSLLSYLRNDRHLTAAKDGC